MVKYDKWSCLERARKLLAAKDDDLLRYACLELRLCIEAIIYQKLEIYRPYVPGTVFLRWQPNLALKTLLQFEPDADEDFTVWVSPEAGPGTPGGDWICLGQHRTVKLSWLNKNYNKLGSYLHARMENSEGVETAENLSAIRMDMDRMLVELEPVVNSEMVGAPLATRIEFKCQACEQKSSVNIGVLRKTGKAICTNPQCGAEYNASEDAERGWQFKLTMTSFTCLKCEKINFLESRGIDVGTRFKCNRCGEVHLVTAGEWKYERVAEVGKTS